MAEAGTGAGTWLPSLNFKLQPLHRPPTWQVAEHAETTAPVKNKAAEFVSAIFAQACFEKTKKAKSVFFFHAPPSLFPAPDRSSFSSPIRGSALMPSLPMSRAAPSALPGWPQALASHSVQRGCTAKAGGPGSFVCSQTGEGVLSQGIMLLGNIFLSPLTVTSPCIAC